MDFSYNDEQEAVRELADRIFSERSTHERLRAVEAAADEKGPFDRSLWAELASAGLLGIGLGEDVGGQGLDFVAEALVIEAAGRNAAAVPVVETMVLGAGTIERFGTEDQRRRLLGKVCAGEAVMTAATAELAGEVVVPGTTTPLATATRRSAGGHELHGTKACVAAGLLADYLLMPVSFEEADGTPGGVGAVVVDAAALEGRCSPQRPTTNRPQALIDLEGVVVGDDAVVGGAGGQGAALLADLTQRGTAALCVYEAGACAAAVALTAEYTKSREQFGKPIATFQAVGQRAADAYVDAEAVRLTAWQAVWRLSEHLPATAEVATAKYWAAEGGQRVVHAAAHLHGGVGVDKDYPLHRFFLVTEEVELTLGAAEQSLQRLGALLAAEPVDSTV